MSKIEMDVARCKAFKGDIETFLQEREKLLNETQKYLEEFLTSSWHSPSADQYKTRMQEMLDKIKTASTQVQEMINKVEADITSQIDAASSLN